MSKKNPKGVPRPPRKAKPARKTKPVKVTEMQRMELALAVQTTLSCANAVTALNAQLPNAQHELQIAVTAELALKAKLVKAYKLNPKDRFNMKTGEIIPVPVPDAKT